MRRRLPPPVARSFAAKFARVGLVGLVVVALSTSALPASAVTSTSQAVESGGSIQAAINAVATGGVVTIAPGTYVEEISIKKSVTLKGDVGLVIIQQPAAATPNSIDSDGGKLIDIQFTSNVTLENLTLDGSVRVAANGPKATGVDANSVDGLTLNNVTVKGFAKNGIAISGKQLLSSPTHSQNVSFNTVTAENNGLAGIAFYSHSSQGVDSDIPGVTFTGTTTITGNVFGIQFGDPGDTHGVQGANDGPVSLGVVAFNDNRYLVDNVEYATNVIVSDKSVVQLAGGASTVDGRAVASSDFLYAKTLMLVPSVSTSTVTVSPSGSALAETAVTVTGKVFSSTAAGTIEIFDGSTSLGSGAANNGVFTVKTSALAVGSHRFTAKFTPTNDENYLPSTSDAIAFSVNEQEPQAAAPVTSTAALTTLINSGTIPNVTTTTSSFVPSLQTVGNPLDNLDVSKPFSGALPWANTADSFVDVYAYSLPVPVGTFSVIKGKVQLTNVDLPALQEGEHHLVFQGQTSGAILVMAINVAPIHLPVVSG